MVKRNSRVRRGRKADENEDMSHLHVVIPVEAHRRARLMAVRSGMLLKSYLARFLMTAEPIGEVTVDAPKEPHEETGENG